MRYTRKRKKIRRRKRGGTLKDTVSEGFNSTVSVAGSTARFMGNAVYTTAGVVERVGEKVIVGTVESGILLKLKPVIQEIKPELTSALREQKKMVLSTLNDVCKEPFCGKLIEGVTELFTFLENCVYYERLLSITQWKPIFDKLWALYTSLSPQDKQKLIAALQTKPESFKMPSIPVYRLPPRRPMYTSTMEALPLEPEEVVPIDYGKIKQIVIEMVSQPKLRLNKLTPAIQMVIHHFVSPTDTPSVLSKFPILIYIANSVGQPAVFMLLKKFVDDVYMLTPSTLPTTDDPLKAQLVELISMFFKMVFTAILGIQSKSDTIESELTTSLNEMLTKIESIQGTTTEPYLQLILQVLSNIDTSARF